MDGLSRYLRFTFYVLRLYLPSLPSRRLPGECAFSPDGLFEARFRVENTPNLREGEQLLTLYVLRFTLYVLRSFRVENTSNLREGGQLRMD